MQKDYNRYSPGSHKLIHHLKHLDSIVKGEVIAPIHISLWPTVVCQRRCDYCCCREHVFSKHSKDDLHLNFDDYKNAIDVLVKYGSKAMEFSGGGEPTLWPHFNEGVEYAHSKGLKLSLITNGLLLKKIPKSVLEKFTWIRVSLHFMEHARTVSWESIPNNVSVNASYIITEKEDRSILGDLHLFAEDRKMPLRIAVQRPATDTFEDSIKADVERFGEPLLFSSKAMGTPKGCYMAWVRAAITWQGAFLPCPSIQLSEENEGRIPDTFPVCHINDLEKWLTENRVRDLGYRCKFCNCGKENNDLIYNLLQGGEDVDFV